MLFERKKKSFWHDVLDLSLNNAGTRGSRRGCRLAKSWSFLNGWVHASSVYAAAAAAKSLQSCPTLCDPMDDSLPGCPVPGILQARTLEWVAISFSNAWKWKVKVKSLSHFWLSATPWTAAHQAPPSMGFSRQEYWSGVSLPSPSSVYMVYIFKVFTIQS